MGREAAQLTTNRMQHDAASAHKLINGAAAAGSTVTIRLDYEIGGDGCTRCNKARGYGRAIWLFLGVGRRWNVRGNHPSIHPSIHPEDIATARL